jgi:cytochrome c-type biogenesis protein CcmH/NrfG
MEIKDRAVNARDSLNRKRLEHKLEDTRQDNERLAVEKHALEEETRRERSEIERILDSLERVSKNAGKKSHRVRGTLTLVLAAGGAYVMGAKAGRERFDQITQWWRDMRTKGMRAKDEAIVEVRDRVEEATSGLPA